MAEINAQANANNLAIVLGNKISTDMIYTDAKGKAVYKAIKTDLTQIESCLKKISSNIESCAKYSAKETSQKIKKCNAKIAVAQKRNKKDREMLQTLYKQDEVEGKINALEMKIAALEKLLDAKA